LGVDRIFVAVACEADDQAIADELVVPSPRNDNQVPQPNAAGGSEER
jgi:hypothetical protein